MRWLGWKPHSLNIIEGIDSIIETWLQIKIWHLAAVLTIVNFESIMIYRVKQALEERKRELQGDIEVKDERSRMVNTEKEEIRRLVSQEVITPKHCYTDHYTYICTGKNHFFVIFECDFHLVICRTVMLLGHLRPWETWLENRHWEGKQKQQPFVLNQHSWNISTFAEL